MAAEGGRPKNVNGHEDKSNDDGLALLDGGAGPANDGDLHGGSPPFVVLL